MYYATKMLVAVGAAGALFSSALRADTIPSFRGLGYGPGTRHSHVLAMSSDASVILGGSYVWESNVLWRDGVPETFTDEGIELTGVSGDGQTLIGNTRTGRAAYWRDGVLTELPPSDAVQPATAECVSADGSVIVGGWRF